MLIPFSTTLPNEEHETAGRLQYIQFMRHMKEMIGMLFRSESCVQTLIQQAEQTKMQDEEKLNQVVIRGSSARKFNRICTDVPKEMIVSRILCPLEPWKYPGDYFDAWISEEWFKDPSRAADVTKETDAECPPYVSLYCLGTNVPKPNEWTEQIILEDFKTFCHIPLYRQLKSLDSFRTEFYLGGTMGWGMDPSWETELMPPSKDAPNTSGGSAEFVLRQSTLHVLQLPFIAFLHSNEFHFVLLFYEVHPCKKGETFSGLVHVEESFGRKYRWKFAHARGSFKTSKRPVEQHDSFDTPFHTKPFLGGAWLCFRNRNMAFLVRQLLEIVNYDTGQSLGFMRTVSVPAKDNLKILRRLVETNGKEGRRIKVTFENIRSCSYYGGFALTCPQTGRIRFPAALANIPLWRVLNTFVVAFRSANNRTYWKREREGNAYILAEESIRQGRNRFVRPRIKSDFAQQEEKKRKSGIRMTAKERAAFFAKELGKMCKADFKTSTPTDNEEEECLSPSPKRPKISTESESNESQYAAWIETHKLFLQQWFKLLFKQDKSGTFVRQFGGIISQDVSQQTETNAKHVISLQQIPLLQVRLATADPSCSETLSAERQQFIQQNKRIFQTWMSTLYKMNKDGSQLIMHGATTRHVEAKQFTVCLETIPLLQCNFK